MLYSCPSHHADLAVSILVQTAHISARRLSSSSCSTARIEIVRPSWIPERSATRLREADLNVLSKLGNQGLEGKPEAFTGGEVGREDDLLDVLVGCAVDIRWRGSHRRKRPLAFSMPPFCHEA